MSLPFCMLKSLALVLPDLVMFTVVALSWCYLVWFPSRWNISESYRSFIKAILLLTARGLTPNSCSGQAPSFTEYPAGAGFVSPIMISHLGSQHVGAGEISAGDEAHGWAPFSILCPRDHSCMLGPRPLNRTSAARSSLSLSVSFSKILFY